MSEAQNSEDEASETVLDECPKCGEAEDLQRGDEYDEAMFSHNETVCLGCDRVFDAFGDQTGGVNNEVASELHSAMVESVKQAAAEADSNE